MVDTETMGDAPPALPFAIGAAPFNLDGEMGRPLRVHIDFEDAFQYEALGVTASTISFWMEQGEKWRRLQEDTVPLSDALQILGRFYESVCEEGARVWCRGADFDFGFVLRPAYDAVGTPLPWSHRRHRDLRTLEIEERTETQIVHDPVSDAIAQTQDVIGHYRS
jgi:hypothetical protein